MTLEEWHDTKFWPAYPTDLSHKKKGSKGESRDAMIKINPDEKERDRIMAAMSAQIRYYRKAMNNNEQEDRWKHACRYIKQQQWDDEIPSTYELQERQSKLKCSCGKPATHPSNRCCACYSKISEKHDPLRDIKVETWNRLGLGKKTGETSDDYRVRMMETAKRNARNIGKL